MIFTKNRGLGGAGYLLAGHPQGELTSRQVNNLYDLARMLDYPIAAASGLQIQRFKAVIPAASTTDFTFTDTVQACSVLGGYWQIWGVNADYDIDIGHTNVTDAFAADLVALIGSEIDGQGIVVTDYMAAEDVIFTINANSNTVPITLELTLLTLKLVTS